MPVDGFRERLKSELAVFEEYHKEIIENTLSRESPLYTISIVALTESCAWIIKPNNRHVFLLQEFLFSTFREGYLNKDSVIDVQILDFFL